MIDSIDDVSKKVIEITKSATSTVLDKADDGTPSLYFLFIFFFNYVFFILV